MEDNRIIEQREGYDVIVAGGGVAGVAAAVAAARTGASVLLIEKTIQLGGLATIGLINWYEPLCDGAGTQMISGIPEELMRLAVRYGYDDLPDAWRGEKYTQKPREGRCATNYSPFIFVMALDEYLRDNNVKLRLDTWAVCPVMGRNTCLGLICESAIGREFFPGKMVVDATGDASVAHRAGVPTVEGDNFFTYVYHYTDRELAAQFAGGGSMARYRRRKMIGSDLYGRGHPENMPLLRGVTGDQVTDFVLAGRKLLFDSIKNDDRRERDVVALSAMPQYRTIRRIVGEYVFDGGEEGVRFDDAVGSLGDFRKKDRHYQLPYRCLYNGGFPNILAAGRVISASGEGWDITRVIPVAALSGQAAGAAAAMCARSDISAGGLDVGKLQDELKFSGVLFV